MLDEILKRDKLLLRDKSDEKELGLQRRIRVRGSTNTKK
jgi:hypothetical protein